MAAKRKAIQALPVALRWALIVPSFLSYRTTSLSLSL
jgi:hypothetical protein